MRCKVFQSRNRADLEEKVNAWLERNPVSSMTVLLSSIVIDDSPDSYFVEHTLVLFYVPLHAI